MGKGSFCDFQSFGCWFRHQMEERFEEAGVGGVGGVQGGLQQVAEAMRASTENDVSGA